MTRNQKIDELKKLRGEVEQIQGQATAQVSYRAAKIDMLEAELLPRDPEPPNAAEGDAKDAHPVRRMSAKDASAQKSADA